MLVCRFCSEVGDHDDFELDRANGRGFWCESCDGFTYFDEDALKQFTLILEDKTGQKPSVNTPPIKLRKQLSPFRFPGGKSSVIDFLYNHLQKGKTKTLYSPFTGGGSFEFAMLDADVVERLHINDLDFGVYSVWWVMLHAPYALIDRIQSIKPTHKDYFQAQAVIKSDYYGVNAIEAAWATFLVNRLSYSGIAKANPLGGKGGTQKALLARWNPKGLISRIEHIHSLSERITVSQEDAVEFIQEAYWDDDSTLFIDPPYIAAGKALYNHYYNEKDHLDLCILLD
jgi:DNA adenine methylase